ncbi:helix-turn-helix domain-containing protein [Nocardia sp. NPDC052566]|uniref:helix-turn-helix domain-containing protein n=1 Tax=Nocardia sp. NPDC052566 TaxID=3364330 RepID=UPI0037CA2734
MNEDRDVRGYRERPSRYDGAVLWTRTVTDGDAAVPVLPDGCIDLIWTEGRLQIAGPDTGAYLPKVPVGTRFAGIRFFPGTAPALLGVPAHELRDRRIALADLWSAAAARRLTEQVDAAADRTAILESFALHRAAELDPPDPLIRHIVTALDAGATIAATAAAAGVNARLLHRRSLAAFGYSPKTLARVLRLQRALAMARAGVPLADTAARAGFADQAHLSREVREFAGTTVRELLSRDARTLAQVPVGQLLTGT